MRGKSVHDVDRLSGASSPSHLDAWQICPGPIACLIAITKRYENPPYLPFYLPHLSPYFINCFYHSRITKIIWALNSSRWISLLIPLSPLLESQPCRLRHCFITNKSPGTSFYSIKKFENQFRFKDFLLQQGGNVRFQGSNGKR
jgi:hypothetical protein